MGSDGDVVVALGLCADGNRQRSGEPKAKPKESFSIGVAARWGSFQSQMCCQEPNSALMPGLLVSGHGGVLS